MINGNNNDNNKKFEETIAKYLLFFLMAAIAAVMVYAIYSSTKTPYAAPSSAPSVAMSLPANVKTPGHEPIGDLSPSPKNTSPSPDESVSPTPEITHSPKKVKITTPAPKETLTPSPEPEKTNSPFKDLEVIAFTGAKPDGPPDWDRIYKDEFYKKPGKAQLSIKSSVWKGVRAYLLDKKTKKYYVLDLNDVKGDIAQVKVPPGDYKLKMIKTGYYTFCEDIPLNDGFGAQIEEPLERRPSLDIKSTPPGAKVYFNDLYAGKTPKVIDNLEEKEYAVKIVKEGYKPEKFKIKLGGSQSKTKEITLDRE